jgi:hypothetical protein
MRKMKKTRIPAKRTKKTRIGSSLAALAIAALFCVPASVAAKKEKSKETQAAFALIAGSIYRPPGFALPGVEVKLVPESSESQNVKLKKAEAVTDARGEFAVRVPAVPAKWRVDVKVNGYRHEQRSVSVTGEQRVDLSIILEPAGQPKEGTQ